VKPLPSLLRKIAMSLLAVVLLLPVLVVLAGQLGAFGGTPPTDLGVRDGRLKAPSATPNSVTSQAALWPQHPMAARAAIAPLRYSGDGRAAMRRLADTLRAMERTTVVSDEPGYLYAQCRTKLLRFTDDVEFWLDGRLRPCAPAGGAGRWPGCGKRAAAPRWRSACHPGRLRRGLPLLHDRAPAACNASWQRRDRGPGGAGAPACGR
jgi:uncharacterized protein (DUF1499 family)